MRRAWAKGSILGCCSVLLWISIASFISMASANGMPEAAAGFRVWLPTTSGTMSQVVKWLGSSQPAQDFNPDIALHANSTNFSTNFSMIGKRIPPLWGRTLATKSVPVTLGFFIPAMVLLLFYIFYQSSRTSSDSNPD